MSRHLIRLGAILLTSAAAFTMPLAAEARPAGGGGAHIGGGGGHFGGGGGHFGGFGGGGHFGGFGGGHLGGGGLHIGGGGLHIGGGHIGGFGGGHVGALHFGGAHYGAIHGGFAGRAIGEGRTIGEGRGVGEGRAIGEGARIGEGQRAFAGGNARFAARGLSRNGWHRFRGAYGWVGPLFWPYAYYDIYDDLFWGYPYDFFWDYGYGDIYGALFSPYDYYGLVGYMGSVAARGQPEISGGIAPGVAAMCGADARDVANYPFDRIQQLIAPDDAQRAALHDLVDASVKAAQVIKAACPTTVPFTPTGRLEAMQARLEAISEAIGIVRSPLDRFYAMLSDEQKARLNAAQDAAQQANRGRSVVQNCNAVSNATAWPAGEIERTVKPTPEQQASLDALRNAVAQANMELAATCPSTLPASPPARLDLMAKRVDVMLAAVKNVRGALGTFYGSLNDEQKAQFNMLGQPRAVQR